MPCICGKCDDKKKTVTKLAIAARDLARLFDKPKQVVLIKDGVLIRDATDAYDPNVTPIVWVGPSCTDEDVTSRVATYYTPQEDSMFARLLAALLEDDDVEDISIN